MVTCDLCNERGAARYFLALGYYLPCVDTIDQARARQGFAPIAWRTAP